AAAGERRNESRHPPCIPAGGRCLGPSDYGREPARRQNPAAGALNRNAVPSSAQPPVSGSIKGASGVTDIAGSPGCYVAAVHLTSSPSLICSVEQNPTPATRWGLTDLKRRSVWNARSPTRPRPQDRNPIRPKA